ncbi:hypothetical protein BDV25DRAFT_143024 [Aspergillus avenaceus]|uniref:DUF6603 domain-containing protein n=1 Tax=Aspergillus avenaceus TaxID=36643 RepID=A0A5N6TLL1_ASPAV|nr:hypothetical protein BDV25DRAFT_143024 [Aspergillus avenaceus]
MSTLVVHSIHISVGIGDSAIHLLVDEAATPKVYAAVLIDGGDRISDDRTSQYLQQLRTKAVKHSILSTIDWIKGHYDLSGDTNKELRLDSIVVTHWDTDHYLGVANVLLEAAGTGGSIPWLKWDGSKPLTYFYAPANAWKEKKEDKKLVGFTFNNFFVAEDSPGSSQYVISILEKDKSSVEAYPFAKLRTTGKLANKNEEGLWGVLGANFFTNKLLPKPSDTVTPDALIATHNVGNGRPGLYCVGVDRKTLKKDTWGQSNASLVERTPFPKDPRIVPGTNPSDANRVSIAGMVMWQGDPGKTPRVSHYFAGDLGQTEEENLLKWLKDGGIDHIRSMKASHHGAVNGTPINMLDTFQPLNTYLPIPTTPRHGHPSWEFIYIWNLYFNTSSSDQDPRFISATYPPYLFKIGDKYQKPLATTHLKNAEFKRLFKDKFKALNQARLHAFPLGDDIEALEALPEKERAKSIADRAVQILLDANAFPPTTYHPALSSAHVLQTGQKAWNGLHFVIIESHDDDLKDGTVYYKNMGKDDKALLPTKQRLPASTSTQLPTATHPATAVKRNIGPPPTVPKKPRTSRLSKLDEEVTDDWLLGLVKVNPGTFQVLPETNPNEMDENGDDGDDGDGEGSFKTSPILRLEASPDRPGIYATMEPSLPAKGWYIFSSDIPEAEIQDIKTYEVLEPGPLDDFVQALHCGVLCLVDTPTVPGGTIRLENQDEWVCWFQDVLNGQELSVTVGTDEDEDDDDSEVGDKVYPVDGFSTNVSLLPIGGKTTPNTTTLSFTTDQDVLEQTFGSTEYVSELGLLTESNVLVFGLSGITRGPATVAINEIIQFVGLKDWFHDPNTGNSLSPIIGLLGILEVTLPSTDAKGHRNAIWFTPGASYNTTIRLQLPLVPAGEAELNSFLDPFKISLSEVIVIARRSSTWSTNGEGVVAQTGGSFALRATATANSSFELDATLEFNPTLTTITLTSMKTVSLEGILDWVGAIVGVSSDQFSFTDLQGKETASFGIGDFQFRRILLHLTKDPSTDTSKVSSFSLDAEVKMSFGNDPILFHLSYTYDKDDGSTVRAHLWGKPPFKPGENGQAFLPEYEDFLYLSPITVNQDDLKDTLSLAHLGDMGTPPSFLPTEVLQAEFIANTEGLYFTGTLVPNLPADDEPVPIFTISDVTLELFYDWGGSSPVVRLARPSFSGGLYVKALLKQPESSTYASPTQLTASVLYDSGVWQLHGSMNRFFASTLAQFFTKEVGEAVIPMIESISVSDLEVNYTFGRNSKPSSFSISADLAIDMHIFTLAYTHSESSWDFTARMEPDRNADAQSNAGNILTSLTGSVQPLPDFLVNILIPTAPDDFVEFSIRRKALGDNERDSIVIIATWVVNGRVFQFIQFRQVPPPGSTQPGSVKRIVMASLTKFPSVTLPMIGDITQPFDQALFLWASTDQGDGITRAELENVNDLLQTPERPKPTVPFKSLTKKGEEKPTDMVLSNGLHFMLVALTTKSISEVIIDYPFSNPKKSGSKAKSREEGTDQGGRMEPFTKALGPLSLKNIGLKYSTGAYGDQSILSIRLDASIMVGPIEFALMGFSIDLDFSKDGASLHNPPMPGFSLEGLSAVFERAPIQIGGLLQLGKENDREYYQGALSISYIPWQFQAAGYWGKTRTATLSHQEFETVFVYCVLRGPLITLEFASIEGICGGFGYNSNLTFPTPQNLLNFPLIMGGNTDPPADGSPLDALQKLLDTSWFFARQDSFWVAAGLTVKAFEILSVQAVVVIQWNPYVQLGIFALATASIPGGKSDRAFAHVQLAIVATVDFETGVLKIEGELTPSSYILDPNCHLTGGFALYSWFDSQDSDLRGDWVFSIGGYHPAYKKPPQYPDISRLGISWQFGSSISITGNAYFAITPKTCMGGGKWDVKLSLNPLYAWFNAFVDFLINYKPFFFIAEGGVSVGVQFTLDLWIVTINIKVELSARLYIEGPPIRGTVHVNFWVFGFDIDFGSKGSGGTDPLSLDDFIELVCQSNTPGAKGILAPSEVTKESTQDYHVYAVEDGLIPKGKIASTPSGDTWIVRATTFTFSINCKFAIQEADVQTMDVNGVLQKPVNTVEGTGTEINARPMHTSQGIQSKLTVSIKPASQVYMEEEYKEPMWNDNEAIYSDVPVALWGKYNASDDPSSNKNPATLLNGTSEKTINLMMGVRLHRPDAVYSEDRTAPYNIELFQLASLDPKPIPITPERSTDLEGMPWSDSEGNEWETVREKWNSRASVAEEAANLCTRLGLNMLGWSEERTKGSDSALVGTAPQNLIDNLEKHYLWAPLLSRA